jgi:hypothetical protein
LRANAKTELVVFTSITRNYLPKARVLARSVKQHCPGARFVLVLCDKENEVGGPFDRVLTLHDLALNVPNLEAWLFSHSIVELCTAVKGAAFLRLFETFPGANVIYLDPDIVVTADLSPVEELLEKHSLVLTPHLTEPYEALEPLLDQEVGLLQHGIFNFGFLAVRSSAEGRRFAGWWNERLTRYCYVDLPRGLFTDQRWGDLIPVFFPDAHILRDKAYNVATWNLLQRKVEWGEDGELHVEGNRLRFYHFSGLDSGLFEKALLKYGADSPAIGDLHGWYLQELEKEGQALLGKLPFGFGCFDDGTPITQEHRVFYRQRPALSLFFPNPFKTTPAKESFLDWYRRKEDRERQSLAEVASPSTAIVYKTLVGEA